jgi:AcrR family transcriptional regulator
VPTEPAPKSRKDKLRSREAILAAARELFASGRDVPMYEIGQRAGVGHATLYRHFSDRAAIVATLCRELVEHIESVSTTHGARPDGIWPVLSATVDALVLNHDFLEVLRSDRDTTLLVELGERTETAFEQPLRRARGAGLVRPDLTVADLRMVLAMINRALDGVATREERTIVGHRALALIRGGLEPR